MNRLDLKLALLCAALLQPAVAAALSSDRQQPIRIQADRVEIDEPAGISTYIGDVVMHQGSMRLEAQRVKVYTAAGVLQRAEADGAPAKFRQRPDDAEIDVVGEARRIELHADESKTVLEGDAHVRKGRDEFSGQRIVYYSQRDLVQAQGGDQGRVEAIIYPKSEQTGAPDGRP